MLSHLSHTALSPLNHPPSLSILEDETEPLKWIEIREQWMDKCLALGQPYIDEQMAKDEAEAERKCAERGSDDDSDKESEWSNDELTVETSVASDGAGTAARAQARRLPRMKTMEQVRSLYMHLVSVPASMPLSKARHSRYNPPTKLTISFTLAIIATPGGG